MSLELAIQSLADAIRDHVAVLCGQGVLPLSVKDTFDTAMIHADVDRHIKKFAHEHGRVPTTRELAEAIRDHISRTENEPPAVETPVSGDRVAETVETPKRGRGRPPKNAPPVPPAPVEPIVETMPLDAEDLQRTLDDYIQQSRDAEAEGPVQPEPERAPIGAEPEPPVFAADAEPITRDKLRDYLMNTARPIPTIGTAGCQRLIQEHGGVAKLSEVPEDRLGAIYTAAVAAVLAAEAASDDLG